MKSELPPEVLILVARHLTRDSSTLGALVKVSSAINALITPILYHSLDLSTTHKLSAFYKSITPEETCTRSLLESFMAIQNRLKFVKHMHVKVSPRSALDPTIYDECHSVTTRPVLSALLLDTIAITISGPLVEHFTIPADGTHRMESDPFAPKISNRPTLMDISKPTTGISSIHESPRDDFTTFTAYRYDLAIMVYALCASNPPIHLILRDLDHSKPETEIYSKFPGISPARRLSIYHPARLEQGFEASLSDTSSKGSGSIDARFQGLDSGLNMDVGKQLTSTRLRSIEHVNYWFPPMWTPLTRTSFNNSTSAISDPYLSMLSSSSDISSISTRETTPDLSRSDTSDRIEETPFTLILDQTILFDDQFESVMIFFDLNIVRSLNASSMEEDGTEAYMDTDEEVSPITVSVRCHDEVGLEMLRHRQGDEKMKVVDEVGRRVRFVENLGGVAPVDHREWHRWVMSKQ